MVFVIARHGQTEDNLHRVFQGQAGKGLNATGRDQAVRLAERLKNVRFDAIVSSDLERAVETARCVSSASAVPVDVDVDRDLREVDLGAWTGLGATEIARAFPEEWAKWEAGLDVRRGGGETYAELAERFERAIRRMAERHHEASARILVVSHGGAIRSWIGRILGLPSDTLRVLGSVHNAALSIVDCDSSGRFKLERYNDVAHLEGESW
jgi:broad specificity phosphatase PhoE